MKRDRACRATRRRLAPIGLLTIGICGLSGCATPSAPPLTAPATAVAVAPPVVEVFDGECAVADQAAQPADVGVDLGSAANGLPAPLTGSYGSEPSQAFDLYLPPAPVGVVLWIHGGAWLGGSRSAAEIHPAIAALFARQWAVVSVDYTTTGATPALSALADVRVAARFVRAHLADLGMSVDAPVIAAGHSAGAHLAMLLAAGTTDDTANSTGAAPQFVDAVVALAGPTNLVRWARASRWCFGTWSAAAIVGAAVGCRADDRIDVAKCDPRDLHRLDPLADGGHGTTPVFLAYGVDDEVVPLEVGDAVRRGWERRVGAERVVFQTTSGSGHAVTGIDRDLLNHFVDALASPEQP